MSAISRREFFQKSATSAAAMSLLAAHVARLKASPLGIPIGSQTYPHRARIASGDFAGLLKDMKGIGIEQIELCDPWNYQEFKNLMDGKATKKMLDDAGVKAVSCHVGMKVYRTQHQDVLNWAHDVGLVQLSTADLGATTKDGRVRLSNGLTTEDDIKAAADEYNAIAAVSKRAGFAQVLHDEAFAVSHTVDGRLTYPILIEDLDPQLVGLQFQMSAMTSVGNPISYFTLYPGRFWSAHLQGVNAAQGVRPASPGTLPDKNAPSGRRGGGGRAAAPARGAMGAMMGRAGGRAAAGGRGQLSLGEDSVDWPKVFAAAKTGGMRNYFVEQSWDLTVKSVAYLKTLS